MGASFAHLSESSREDEIEAETVLECAMKGDNLKCFLDLTNRSSEELWETNLWPLICYNIGFQRDVTFAIRIDSEEQKQSLMHDPHCFHVQNDNIPYALIGSKEFEVWEIAKFFLENYRFQEGEVWLFFAKRQELINSGNLFENVCYPLIYGNKQPRDLECVGRISDGNFLLWHKCPYSLQEDRSDANDANGIRITESALLEAFEKNPSEGFFRLLTLNPVKPAMKQKITTAKQSSQELFDDVVPKNTRSESTPTINEWHRRKHKRKRGRRGKREASGMEAKMYPITNKINRFIPAQNIPQTRS